MSDCRSEIESIASKALKAVASGKARTAWELKMQLKVSHTRLHLALGMLLERGAVTMRPDRLTYSVEPAVRPQEDSKPQTPAEAPTAASS